MSDRISMAIELIAVIAFIVGLAVGLLLRSPIGNPVISNQSLALAQTPLAGSQSTDPNFSQDLSDLSTAAPAPVDSFDVLGKIRFAGAATAAWTSLANARKSS